MLADDRPGNQSNRIKACKLPLLVVMTMGNVAVVSTEWVHKHINDKDLRILDVREDPYAYFAGHLPNAVHMVDETLRCPSVGVPVQYLPLQYCADQLMRAGVNDNLKILVYSDGMEVLGATMVCYVLDRLSVQEILFMDGGWTEYSKHYPTTLEYPCYEPDTLTVKNNEAIKATLKDIEESPKVPNRILVDARPAKSFRGEVKLWPRNGHIPGAVNIFWRTLTDPSNTHRLKPIEELAAIYENAGVTKDKEIIVYCGTSREASIEYVILKYVLGYPKVRLYEGSWTEYSAHLDLESARAA